MVSGAVQYDTAPRLFEVSYDEFVIEAVVTYAGTPLVFPTHAPTRDEILEADDGRDQG